MSIPLTQIQAASVSALPQQVHRETRSVATPSMDSLLQQVQVDKLDASNETTERDAQERYEGAMSSKKKPDSPTVEQGNSSSDLPSSIWNLSVADEQPPPDLDIRG